MTAIARTHTNMTQTQKISTTQIKVYGLYHSHSSPPSPYLLLALFLQTQQCLHARRQVGDELVCDSQAPLPVISRGLPRLEAGLIHRVRLRVLAQVLEKFADLHRVRLHRGEAVVLLLCEGVDLGLEGFHARLWMRGG
jgi:hypothetical protein